MEINIKGHVVLIDEEDYEYLMNAGTWRVVNNKGYLYAVRSIWDNNKKYTVKQYMHRELLGNPDGMLIDHKNRNTLDNRRENLRIATKQQNQCNRKPQNTKKHSEYKGVTYFEEKNKPWRGYIKSNGKTTSKHFFTELEAAKWYNERAKEIHGEFAYLNDVGD